MRVALKRPKTIVERLINRLSGGRGYCHAQMIFNSTPGWIGLTSLPKFGVEWICQLYPADQWTVYEVGFEWTEEMVIALARPEIGCRYDYLGVARFVLKFLRQSPTRWFCSELVVSQLQHVGMFPTAKAWKVSPNRLDKMLSGAGYKRIRPVVAKV